MPLAKATLGFAARPHIFAEPFAAARMLPASQPKQKKGAPPPPPLPTQKVPLNEGQLTPYDMATALEALADPCNSCKFMCHQLVLGIKGDTIIKGKSAELDEKVCVEWNPSLSVERVKKLVKLAD
jgi:hypothetical protein